MNIFSKIGLGILTTLATVVPTAQAGYVADGYHMMDGSDFGQYSKLAGPMISNLNKIGVPVLSGEKNDFSQCEAEGNTVTLGFYVPAYNFMVICDGHGHIDLMMETLTHETVHVIQDLRDGLHNDTLVEGSNEYLAKLENNIDPSKVQNIMSLYDQEDWKVELEAFFFETRPESVNEELTKWVF